MGASPQPSLPPSTTACELQLPIVIRQRLLTRALDAQQGEQRDEPRCQEGSQEGLLGGYADNHHGRRDQEGSSDGPPKEADPGSVLLLEEVGDCLVGGESGS